jgi:hypothetical protein
MKLQPDAERRGCRGKTKMNNEKKNVRDREIGKRESRKLRDAEGR